VLAGWNQISTTLAFGTLNAAALSAHIAAANTVESDIAKLESQLNDKRNQREFIYLGMWDKVKRARAGIKANFGDDSPQFDLIGETRISERKTPSRKAPAA
jgi:hypothetical protein